MNIMNKLDCKSLFHLWYNKTMKKICIALLILFCSPVGLLFSAPSDLSYHTLEDMHRFSTNYPRHENSVGEEESFQYILDTLEELGVPSRLTELDSFDTFHSFSSIVSADFSGPEEGEVYLIFPVNHPAGADKEHSGSAGLSVAMALCRTLAAEPPMRNVHILFMGAEFGRSGDAQLGTQAFLQDYFSNTPDIFVYIDLRTLPSRLEFKPYGTDIVSPAWLVRHTSESFFRNGIPYDFSTLDFTVHQLGFNSSNTLIDPYLSNGNPSIYIGDGPQEAETEKLTGEELSAFFTDFLNTLPRTLPSQWDRHYLFFKIKDKTLILSELSYVLILLFLFAAVLLYPFIEQKRFFRYLRSIRHNSWILPLIFILVFVYLLISTLLLEGISTLRDDPLLWQQEPFLMLLLKIGFAVFLFALSHRVTAPFHLNRLRGSFYSSAGLLFLLIDVIILTSYNLTLTIYGALLFFLGFLFTVVRSRLFKLFYLLVSISVILFLLVKILQLGSSQIMFGILRSHVRGNLIISFHLLPYLLFFLRLIVLFHHPRRPVMRRINLASYLVFGLLSVSLIVYFLVFYQPGQNRPELLTIRERLDTVSDQHTVRLESSEALDGFSFETWAAAPVRISEEDSEGKSADFTFPLEKDLVQVRIFREIFLGRATYELIITADSPPERIEAVIESSSRIDLYDADFPSQYSADRKRLGFLIGGYPELPFRMSFTLPEAQEGTLIVRADYYAPPYPLDLGPENYDLDYRLTAVNRIPLSSVPLQDRETTDSRN